MPTKKTTTKKTTAAKGSGAAKTKKTVKKTTSKRKVSTKTEYDANGKTLIIVESPTKARTISGFLDNTYKIESSFGHIRDLPKSKLGIDEETFEPSYVIPTKSRKRVNELKKLASEAKETILATDEDREGEAIAWHLKEILGISDADEKRIAFHEITKPAIEEALQHPRKIENSLVDAQTARRILDRLVGYKLSPFLWRKVMKGLSAGRVQSAAVRLIVEREEEIRKFLPETYYTVSADLKTEDGKQDFEADLSKINGKALPKPGIKTKEEAEKITADLRVADLSTTDTETKESRRNPYPPFTTSTLQQEASRRLRLSAKMTMNIAQGLYEKGYITYMRTDSVNLSNESLAAAEAWIKQNLGEKYATETFRRFKTKSKSAQEAHEAIRPTNPSRGADSLHLEERDKKLYDLIWRRFMASQLPQAVFEQNKAVIEAKMGKENYELIASGSKLKFDGFLKVWPTEFEEKTLPYIEKGSHPILIKAAFEEHQTEPPARYNEASLIKTLEDEGIGRPSTYASIVSVIQERNYVEKNEDKRFLPTQTGELVNKLLVENFPEVVDVKFTASMEEEFDDIAEGKIDWKTTIGKFYTPFSKNLAEKYETVEKQNTDEPSDEICEKCGKPMVIKTGRFGKFLACTGYPECKNTKKILKEDLIVKINNEPVICPKCGIGNIIKRRSKARRIFFGCSNYPNCDYATWDDPSKPKKETKKQDE